MTQIAVSEPLGATLKGDMGLHWESCLQMSASKDTYIAKTSVGFLMLFL